MLRPVLFLTLIAAVLGSQHLSADERTKIAANRLESLKGEERFAITQPGPEHHRLADLEGSWTVRKSDTAAKKLQLNVEKEWTATAKAEAILGNRFLVIDASFTAREGLNSVRFTIGFDRRYEEHTLIHQTSTSTVFMMARGKARSDAIRLYGEDDDPRYRELHGIGNQFAYDLRIPNRNEFSLNVFLVRGKKREILLPHSSYEFHRNE